MHGQRVTSNKDKSKRNIKCLCISPYGLVLVFSKGKVEVKSPKTKKVAQEKQYKEKLRFSSIAQKGKEMPEIVSSHSVVSYVHAFL